jgi:hypothetical protein
MAAYMSTDSLRALSDSFLIPPPGYSVITGTRVIMIVFLISIILLCMTCAWTCACILCIALQLIAPVSC